MPHRRAGNRRWPPETGAREPTGKPERRPGSAGHSPAAKGIRCRRCACTSGIHRRAGTARSARAVRERGGIRGWSGRPTPHRRSGIPVRAGREGPTPYRHGRGTCASRRGRRGIDETPIGTPHGTPGWRGAGRCFPGARSSGRRAKDGHGGHCRVGSHVAARVFCHGDPCAVDLTLATTAAELLGELDDLRETAGSDRVSFAFQAAAGVDRQPAPNAGVALANHVHGPAGVGQPEFFEHDQLGRRGGVVAFQHVHLGWVDAGPVERPLRHTGNELPADAGF